MEVSKHHPSCTPSDRDLVWLCAQCGGHESAENLEMPSAVRLALKVILNHVEPDWENCKTLVAQWLDGLPK